MLSICNMLLVIFVLFGRNQLYSIDSLPEALHVKVNAPPSIIVLFSGVRVITGVSRSKVESRQVPEYIRRLSVSPASSIYSVAVINVRALKIMASQRSLTIVSRLLTTEKLC